jgi:hypothetical protein
MRAAAVLATTIIVLGLYLAIAAGLAMSASWIGIGMLSIAAAGATGVMLTSRQVPPARHLARS